MPQCPICRKEIYSAKLKTVGNQVVCSLSCVGLLNGNETDSCNYCKRPVWRDNYYKIEDKLCCSEFCRDIISEKLNIPKNSSLIKHFQENIFININPTSLKNTKQLREEVLKVYNDFKFDTNEDISAFHNSMKKERNSKNNLTYKRKETNNSKDYLNRNNRNNNKIKELKSLRDLKEYLKKNNTNHNYLLRSNDIDIYQSKNLRTKIINNIKEVSKSNDLTLNRKNNIITKKDNSKDNRVNHDNYILKNPYNNYIKNSNNNKRNKVRTIRITDLEGKKNNYSNNKYNINDKDGDYNNYKKINKTIDNENTNYFYNYNRINNSNNELNYKNLNKSYINDKKGINNNNNIHKKNYSTSKKIKTCKICLKKLGSIAFLDRNGNHFCSDQCKHEFLKNK